ncbi:AIPR family protein [Halioxenophilus aromaticivorans]|uniref:AIPR family protein n=1 Tax=Halioxenophilus aromaticivorans TaxID=1306992 RepID=A0AAV3U0I7_9ALTE
MHRIVKSHLDSFTKSFGLEQLDESVQFEMFANYSILRSRIGSDFDIEDVTTGEGDDGMDGVSIIVNEEVVVSDEDATSMFSSDRKNNDVEALFIQAKRGDSFDLGDFLKFKESVLRFINSENYTALDAVQQNARKIFDVCIENVPKIRGGKPDLTARFVTTGVYRAPEALEAAIKDFRAQIEELGYFGKVDIQFIGRDEITNLWVSTYSSISAELPMFSNAPLPSIHGIDEAYLAVVKAKDLVSNLLETDDGNLRSHVFEENVRAFLGIDNPVNKSISETLSENEKATRFPVLNNGITIVSPDVRVQGNILHLENYQIVNGCQTSNVLFECRESLDDSVMVNLKVVETSSEDVFSELVRATNSQSKVEETQFISLRPVVRRIEDYFNTYEGHDGRLYFERRDRQYVGRDVPIVRTFNINVATKCVTSMFLQRPDLAYRYPKRMYELFSEDIYSNDTKEVVFYTSCLALYRLHLLVASADIPQNVRKYKWHLIVLVRAIIAGKEIPKLNSNKMEQYCQKIIDACSSHGDALKAPFRQAVEILLSVEDLTDDRLKRQAVMDEMLDKI